MFGIKNRRAKKIDTNYFVDHDLSLKMLLKAYYGGRLLQLLRRMLTYRYLVLFLCITLTACSLLWNQYPESEDLSSPNGNFLQQAIDTISEDARFAEIYRKKEKLPKDLKYILFWTDREYAPFMFYKTGQRTFIENKCPNINCYITADRQFVGSNFSKFDAILFNGRTLGFDFPEVRWPHQRYIYVNSESADNNPVCNRFFDGFFNWTSTYRIDSDIPYLYIRIRNEDDEVVGPGNVNWLKETTDIDEDLASRLQNKSKAAAWFVSNCNVISGREHVVSELQKALSVYGMEIDIYGSCGPLKCPRENSSECLEMLQKDYFFYLSFENSFDEDYVTEKVLTALEYETVPIVYGGANYSRFLPPFSYLDARDLTIKQLASTMYNLTVNPSLYRQYFWWKKHYIYYSPHIENMCAICTALNNKTMMETQSVHENFRSWWNPTYRDACT